jgi:Transcriptional regulatory protein, C terminal
MLQNVALPEDEMNSGLDRMHPTTPGMDIAPLSPPPSEDGVGTHASQIRLRQLLANVPDSDRYQVALVSSTEQVSADHSASPPSAHQILFLPLTWKDISVLMPTGNRNIELVPKPDGVRFGDVHVDLYRMQVVRRGKVVELTAQEFKVLKFMVLNPNRAISRDELLNQAWGYENYPCTRTVDSHVWRLRRKLELEPSNPLHFRTISRVGYKFVP